MFIDFNREVPGGSGRGNEKGGCECERGDDQIARSCANAILRTGIGGDVGAATDEPVYARAPSSRVAAAQSGDTAWTGIGGDVGAATDEPVHAWTGIGGDVTAATDEPVYARAPSSRARFELVAYKLCLCHYDMVQLGLITLVSSPLCVD